MKKLKVFMLGLLSVLTLGLFVVTGAKVNAETTSFYLASNDKSTTAYAKNAVVKNDDDIMSFTINNGTNVLSTTSAILKGSYTKALVCKGNGNGFTFTANTDGLNVTVYFSVCNSGVSEIAIGKSWTFGTDSNSSTTDTLYSSTLAIGNGSSATLQASGARIALFEVKYEIITSTDYKATFSLGDGVSGSNPSDITVSKNAENKNITLPTTTATKAGFVFGGWNDGTTTYAAGETYELLSDKTFTAVWNYNGSQGTNTKATFDSMSSINGELKYNTYIDGTIYKVYASSDKAVKINSNSQTVNSVKYSYRLQLQGAADYDSSSKELKARFIEFTVSSAGTLKIVTKADNRTLALYGDTIEDIVGEVNLTSTVGWYSIEVPSAGTYRLASKASGIDIWALDFITLSDNTTTSVFAEKNTTTDTLRFVGTITGISKLSDIDTIELVLLKDDKATSKQIFLTTCFTAVTGTTQTCEAATGTYYVVYRISGISAIAGSTISKKLVVTFTDGSKTTCDATTINV